MRVTKKTTLEATAYHEAGHAVVAWSLGIKIKSASIVADEESAGRVFRQNAINVTGNVDPHLDDSPRARYQLERQVMFSLAGHEAQKAYNPRSVRKYHASSDHQTAIHCAFELGGSTEAANLYLKLLVVWTRARLRDYWPEVEALAEKLVERGSMSGEDVRRTILEARGIPIPEYRPSRKGQSL